MNKRAFFALGCIALGFFSFLITGCNPPTLDTVPVSGKITVDGQPIPQGVIIFHAADGQTASGGGAIENGVYKAEVPLGKKIVLVNGGKIVGKEPLYQGVPDSPTRDKIEAVTPMEYNHKETSNLTADITGKTENLNFELDSKFKK